MSIPAPPSGPYLVYSGRVTNWAMVLASGLLAIPLLGLGAASGEPAGRLVLPMLLVLLVGTANLLTATNIRTTTGPEGVRIRFGALGVPRVGYPRDRITRAEVVDVGPWSVSLGYWWTPRSTWCTVRTGPALRLTLDTGRTVTVTVPHPHDAVAALRLVDSS